MAAAFFFPFLQEHPCLAWGAALAGSGYSSFWQQLTAQPPGKVNAQIPCWDEVQEGCGHVLAVSWACLCDISAGRSQEAFARRFQAAGGLLTEFPSLRASGDTAKGSCSEGFIGTSSKITVVPARPA